MDTVSETGARNMNRMQGFRAANSGGKYSLLMGHSWVIFVKYLGGEACC